MVLSFSTSSLTLPLTHPSPLPTTINVLGKKGKEICVLSLLLNHLFVYPLVRQSMGVLSGPLVDLTLLLRQTVGQTDGLLLLALLGLVLFASVCLLLYQLIVYIWWKLGQGERVVRFYPTLFMFFPPHVEAIPLR